MNIYSRYTNKTVRFYRAKNNREQQCSDSDPRIASCILAAIRIYIYI